MQQIQYVNFTSKKRFGVELEVNKVITQKQIENVIKHVDNKHAVYVTGWGHTRNNDYWHVKTDSTCGDLGKGKDDGGWEIASFVAKGYKDVSLVGKVVDAIRNGGAKVNKNCGLHIHVDVAVRDMSSVCYLLSNWLRVEHIFYEIVPDHRRNNIYCESLRQKMKLSKAKDSVDELFLADKIYTHTSHDADRRVSFNICNLVKSSDIKTVELRLPEGTLNHHAVKHWIRLFVHFIDTINTVKPKAVDSHAYDEHLSLDPNLLTSYIASKQSSIKKSSMFAISPASLVEAMSILGLCGQDKFYILSNSLRSTKIWFLRRILRYSTNLSLVTEAKNILSNLT